MPENGWWIVVSIVGAVAAIISIVTEFAKRNGVDLLRLGALLGLCTLVEVISKDTIETRKIRRLHGMVVIRSQLSDHYKRLEQGGKLLELTTQNFYGDQTWSPWRWNARGVFTKAEEMAWEIQRVEK